MEKGFFKKGILLFLLVFCMTLTAAPVLAADTDSDSQTEQTKKNGVVQEGKYYYCYENGELVKNSWVTWKNQRYYFNAKGRAIAGACLKYEGKVYVFSQTGKLLHSKKARMVTFGTKTWYVSKDGIASTGWFTVNGKLYYADSKGRLYKDRTKEGVTFKSNGAAKNDTASQLKILTMKIVSEITNSSMTKSQKLRACWNYVLTHMTYAYYYPSGKTGWQRELALIGLKNKAGNCYGFACAFAALAREVGYDPYVVSGRVTGTRDGASDGLTRHCWVMIGGCYYDPEAQYKGWMKGIYGAGTYPINHTVTSTIRFAD